MRRSKSSRLVVLATFVSVIGSFGLGDAVVRARTAGINTRQQVHITYASWYGREFEKRTTASGEPFNPRALTAAHRTLPLGSEVRVTNLTNGRSVVVKITDRGPYLKGRGIDVSHAAASRLHMLHQGVAKVKVEEIRETRAPEPVTTALAAWPSAPSGSGSVSL